jgi:two-component system, OmpR family, response regulator VicR
MLKILVIDDEEQVLDIISLVLKTLGYNVVKARDGQEGIRKFDESFFDIVITDFNMPFYNGDEVARHIHNANGDFPIICITGAPEDIDFNCFDIVLGKPFSFTELAESVKKIVNARTTIMASC